MIDLRHRSVAISPRELANARVERPRRVDPAMHLGGCALDSLEHGAVTVPARLRKLLTTRRTRGQTVGVVRATHGVAGSALAVGLALTTSLASALPAC